jgi:ribose 5-phosphate isomerase RpiB
LACDGVRAVSEWEKNEMIIHLLNKKKINVITNGIEDEAYEDVEKKASPKIKKQVAEYGRYLI